MALADVSKLEGAALDWAVAAALELQLHEYRVVKICRKEQTTPAWIECEIEPGSYVYYRFSPSTDWHEGGRIVAMGGIATRRHKVTGKWYAITSDDLGDGTIARWDEMTARGGMRYGVDSWAVRKRRQRFEGPTLLIAAMRCYVASVVGAEIALPDALQ